MDQNNLDPASLTVTPETWGSWTAFVREQFGVSVDDAALEKFKILLNELIEWNQKFNLVSFRTAKEILWRHFADSLAGAGVMLKHGVAADARIIDIGAGAGFPGLPTKIVLPGCRINLLESITKKCTFIEHIIQKLGMADASVINDRAEIIGQAKGHRAAYDVVLSRAMAKFSPNLEFALPLLKPGGILLLYKTESAAFGPEGLPSVAHVLKTLAAEQVDTLSYAIPGQEHRYCVLAIKKTGPTPPQYPRRVGVPEKKPL